MNLIILSTCIGTSDIKKVKNAAEKFELNIVKGLSEFFNKIYILSPNILCNFRRGKEYYLSVGRINRFTARYAKWKLDYKNNVLITFGYNPLVLLQIKSMKRQGAYPFAYIYDSHEGMNLSKNLVKRKMVDMFYRIGIKWLNGLEGIMLFHEEAYKDLNVHVPYIVTTITSSGCYEWKTYQCEIGSQFKVVYAGTLTEYNSIKEICKTASIFYRKGEDIVFWILGDGPLLLELRKKYVDVPNLFFIGRVDNLAVKNYILKADLVLNIRKENPIMNKYSIPSKVVECLEWGKLLLTTEAGNVNSLNKVACVIHDTDIATLYMSILFIKNNYKQVCQRLYNIPGYLNKYHNRKVEMRKIKEFIYKELS